MGSSAGCAICMRIISECLAAQTYAAAAAVVAFMSIVPDCFTFGIMPVSWLMLQSVQETLRTQWFSQGQTKFKSSIIFPSYHLSTI